MRRLPFLVSVLCLTLGLFAVADADASTAKQQSDLEKLFGDDPPQISRDPVGENEYFVKPASGLSKATMDTVYLFGGPGTLEGKFQSVDGGNGGAPDPQGWFGADRTETAVYWNVSEFNAQNFAGPAGNRAIWSGVPAGTPGFVSAPGYGNGWDDRLIYEQAVTAGVSHSARLQFEYNYDTEPAYDFFTVDYDSAGTWINLLTADGTNDDGSGTFPTPAVFDQTVNFPVGSLSNGEIRFRIHFTSDGAASDQDLFFDSIGGACQVDNIRVTIDGNLVSVADFEGSPGDADWVPEQAPFAGDFAKMFTLFQDLDPCATNITPQFGFLDDGTAPSNSSTSTGGSLSPNWQYGVDGTWVTNYTGGVSFGEVELFNSFWSPELDWDLPGTEDDAAQGGAFFRFSLWEHLPLRNGMFWIWEVRSFPDAQGNWTDWTNRNLVIYEDLPTYSNTTQQVVDLLVQNPEKVQLSLGVIDLSDVFSLPGGDATPAPLFDNVAFARYRVGGPAITSINFERLQDGFPQGGSINPADLSALSIRLDAPQDLIRTQGPNIVAGDSMTVQVAAVVPGTSIDQPPALRYVLDANPLFDGVRSLPPGASVLETFTGRDGRQWNRWTGEIVGGQSTNAVGADVPGDFFFDFPDGPARAFVSEPDEPAMFFPGDELRFYVRCVDSAGNVTTAPAGLEDDPAAFAHWEDGSWGIAGRGFTVRGLPSLLDPDGDGTPEQPEILVINDFGRRGGENDFLSAFNQNGLQEGVGFDTYTVMDPDGAVGNGIGTPGVHGATAGQLEGYRVIFYDSGDLTFALGDGTVDKSDDIGVLTQWNDLAGDRYLAFFGDYVASSLATGPAAAQSFLQTQMGVNVTGADVRGDIGGQTAPVVSPDPSLAGVFSTDFVAYGGCIGINEFDAIEPVAAAQRSHQFTTPSGALGAYGAAAGVWFERQVNAGAQTYRRVSVTFPFGMNVLWDAQANKAPSGASARSQLFGELLTAFQQPINDPGATSSTPIVKSKLLGNTPNPFNPTTSIQLRVGVPGRYSLRIYNVRGELVRTLVDAELGTGERSVVWDGRDGSGRTVSSGVYLSKFVGPDVDDTGKLMLLK